MTDAKVFIGADTNGLRSGVSAAKREMSAFSMAAKPVGEAFTNLKGVVLGALSIGAIVSATRAAVEYGDSIAKASAKSGIGAQQFQALAYAAKQSDVEMSALSTSIRMMQTNIDEAATGSKAANATLAALGLTASDLKRLAPEQQFELLAEQISRLEDPAQRARAATEMFGRAGAELLPMFEKGADGIRQASAEARQLGVVLSDKAIDDLADVDDKIKKLSASWDALANSLIAKAAPAGSAFLDFLRKATVGPTEIERLTTELQNLRELTENPLQPNASATTLGMRREALKRQAIVQARLNELGAVTSTGGSGPASRGAHQFPSLEKPPGFTPDAGKAEESAAMKAFLNRQAGSGMSGGSESTRLVMRNGQLVPETAATTEGMDALGNEVQLEAMRVLNEQKLELHDAYNQAVVSKAQWREATVMSLVAGSEEMQTQFRQAAHMSWAELIEMGVGVAAAGNSRLAKMQQSLAIAQIVWNTGGAIMRAMRDVPFPANLAAAAKVAAMGAIQIAQVRAAKYSESGGGGGSVGIGGTSTGGSVADRAGADAPTGEVQDARPVAQVVINGNVFSSQETADWFIEQIRDAVDNKDVMLFSANSRQAFELAGVPG